LAVERNVLRLMPRRPPPFVMPMCVSPPVAFPLNLAHSGCSPPYQLEDNLPRLTDS
jgi:hypothetical protein